MKKGFYFILLVLLFALMVAVFIDTANAQELIETTDADSIGSCISNSETADTHQQFIINKRAYVQKAVISLKKSSGFATGVYSLALLVNDELKGFSFYNLANLRTTYSDIELNLNNVFIKPNDEVIIAIIPIGSLTPHALYAGSQIIAYPGETYCNGISSVGDINTSLWGISQPTFNNFGLIATAHASTSCQFVISDNTTTAECSDPVVRTIDEGNYSFYGLVLFFIVFFGILFYHKTERR